MCTVFLHEYKGGKMLTIVFVGLRGDAIPFVVARSTVDLETSESKLKLAHNIYNL